MLECVQGSCLRITFTKFVSCTNLQKCPWGLGKKIKTLLVDGPTNHTVLPSARPDGCRMSFPIGAGGDVDESLLWSKSATRHSVSLNSCHRQLWLKTKQYGGRLADNLTYKWHAGNYAIPHLWCERISKSGWPKEISLPLEIASLAIMASVIAMCGSVCKTWGSAKNGMTMQGGVSKCLKLQFFVIVRINVIKKHM